MDDKQLILMVCLICLCVLIGVYLGWEIWGRHLQKEPYLCLTHDGITATMELYEGLELIKEATPGQYDVQMVFMSRKTFNELPEFSGW